MPITKAEATRRYRVKHPAAVAAVQWRAQEKRREAIRAAKSRPCMDCKQKYPPYVMDFDHVRGAKCFNIGESTASAGLARLLLEIEKCDVVCSNCHRERTWSRSRP